MPESDELEGRLEDDTEPGELEISLEHMSDESDELEGCLEFKSETDTTLILGVVLSLLDVEVFSISS